MVVLVVLLVNTSSSTTSSRKVHRGRHDGEVLQPLLHRGPGAIEVMIDMGDWLESPTIYDTQYKANETKPT